MGDEPDWDSYFLNIAKTVATKSKDVCKVGAVIVNPTKLVVSTGFNGLPRGLSSEFERELVAAGERDAKGKSEKLGWMVHAEENAILNSARTGASTVGGRIYINKFPCFHCLSAIIQAGITSLYTDDNDYWRGDRISDEGKLFLSKRLRVDAPNHPDFIRKVGSERPPILYSDPPPRSESVPPAPS